MSLLGLVWLGLVALLGLIVKLALEKEYAFWASALARLLVKVAGVVCRTRSREWLADLLYMQKVGRESGLLLAATCLISSPVLRLRQAAIASSTSWARRLGAVLGGVIVVLGSVVAAATLVLALSSFTNLLNRPTEGARAEAAARQQAALDAAWRPWTTAAENLAVVSLCLAVPAGIALTGAAVIGRLRDPSAGSR
jgi:hypothetical protein